MGIIWLVQIYFREPYLSIKKKREENLNKSQSRKISKQCIYTKFHQVGGELLPRGKLDNYSPPATIKKAHPFSSPSNTITNLTISKKPTSTLPFYRPSWRSSEKTAVREMLSLSKTLRPEKGPEENIEDVPSDSKVVDDCRRLGRTLEVVMESWYSVTLCTILRDCTTSPIVGRWLASGATQAAAIVQTRMKSSFGYFPPSLGSASSSSRSLSLRIGLAWKK